MKKFLSALLALSFVLSLTGCKKNDTGESGAESVVGTDGSTSQDSVISALYNPVKRTADGDIDMDAALAYETDYDALKASLAAKTVDVNQPVSENARKNETTMEVWNYLRSIYGKQMLVSQEYMDLGKTYEDLVYYNATGDLPAMKGFDFIFSTGDYQNTSMIDAAIEWSKNSGGLVNFTWHWYVPRDIDDVDMGYAFYQEDIINFNPLNATTPGTKEYEIAVHDIDLIAGYLQQMEAEGVTVLFRPFHEASGAWFWWGLQPDDKKMIKDGTYPETYQRLWYMMFDRLENYHKLSNIIWVWNGQTKFCEVDPNTYDISGVDYYASTEDHSPLVSEYEKLAAYTYEGKMLALTECGYIPDPQQCADQNAMWLYYMPWYGDFVYEAAGGAAITDIDGTPSPNTERMTEEMLKEYFSNEHMVTWSKLPEFSFGEHNMPERITVYEYFKNASE